MKVHLNHFSKIKSKKSHKTVEIMVLLTIFVWIEGSGSKPLTNGSGFGSRRPKNTDPTDPDLDSDPDPQH